MTIALSAIGTLVAVGLLVGAFIAGIAFERRRRERFEQLVEDTVASAQARLDAAIAAAGRSEQAGQFQPSVH